MPRDYRRKTKKKTSASPLRWLVSGFGLGLIAALGLYLQMKPDANHEVAAPNARAEPQSASDDDASNDAKLSVAHTESDPGEPSSLPAQGDPDYEFYDVLPGFVVEVPDTQENPGATRQAARPASPAAQKSPSADTSYMLQTGSFRRHADADRRKAQVGLMGYSSTIQEVSVKGENWFRVYIGPTRNRDELENTRSRLRSEGIDALLLREK